MGKETPQARALHRALIERGIHCQLEAYDGHKHVDISIPWAKLDIEIDGLQHYIDPRQMRADLDRSFYSRENDEFDTIHLPNIVIEHHLCEVADAIAKVAREDYSAIKKSEEGFNLVSFIKSLLNKP